MKGSDLDKAMKRTKTLIPASKNPPAKVKDKGLVRLARAGAAAFDAGSDRILWLPLGASLAGRIRSGLAARFLSAGVQPVRCGPGEAGTLPVAVRALKTVDQLPLCLMEDSADSILLEGFDTEGSMPGWAAFAERLVAFLQERGLDLSVFEEASLAGERTVVACGCDADARGALEARYCGACGWAGSVDALLQPEALPDEEESPLQPVVTPGATTIAELCRQLGCAPERTIKTMFYAAEQAGTKTIVAALVRGDRAVSSAKLSRALGGASVRRAESLDLKQASCDVAGFLGPVGLPGTIRVIADLSVQGTKNRVVGANLPETHLTGACWGRDYEAPVADISALESGAPCPACGKPVEKAWVRPVASFRVGHPALAAFPSLGYLDENRKRHVPVAWSGRVLVEALALASAGDGDAPFKIGLAPADVLVLPLEAGGEAARNAAVKVAEDLGKSGWIVLLDDRETPDEPRLAEAVLTGCPVRVLVGAEAKAEVSLGEVPAETVPLAEIAGVLEKLSAC